jgi:predicted O-linked N-acetylglucosamine transferase (SPINDLY family)
MRLALAWLGVGRHSEARTALEALVKAHPTLVAAWDNLGYARKVGDDLAGGIEAHRQAVALDPRYISGWHNLGLSLAMQGEVDEARECQERVLALDPSHRRAASARLLMMQYSDVLSPEARFDAHRAYGEMVRPRTTVAASIVSEHEPRTRLRVGFVSPDFRQHSVAHFIEPLLAHLDRSIFETVLYHDHATEDAVSARLRGHASHWRPIAGLADDAVEKIIRADSPDILIDLSAHTGRTRLPLFARRLAPVQMTYLGYPDTTGLAEMDVRLTDAEADPVGEADRWHTERLVRFSPCAWSYLPPEDAPAVAPPPGGDKRSFTFGSFNHLAKINATTLNLWSAVLAAVPGSRLMLKSMGLDIPATQATLRSRLRAAGIADDRVELLGPIRGVAAHLALYAQVDVTLDPFPYHGTTTTCEALWMGRPVVTLAGDRHASRVGASLLNAVGHPEWIAETAADYVRIAAELAADRAALAGQCHGLRDTMRGSVLMDHAGQAVRFGEALLGCRASVLASVAG